MKLRLSLLASVVLVGIFTIVGCGEEVDHQTCEFDDQEDGSTIVSCDDGNEYTVADGIDGRDGEDGQDGTSCSVDDSPPDGTQIECEDGTSAFVADGEDGEDGDPGSACWVEDNNDGSYDLNCDDGSSVTITDGADGQDGEDGFDCDLVEDDGYTLECEDGTEISLGGGGDDASECTVDDNGDGTGTLSCTGSPSLTFNLISDDAELRIFTGSVSVDFDDIGLEAIIQNRGSDDYTDSFDVNFYIGFSSFDDIDDFDTPDDTYEFDDGLDAGENWYAFGSYTATDDGNHYLWVEIVDDNGDRIDYHGPTRFQAGCGVNCCDLSC